MAHFVRVRHLRGFVDDRGGEETFEGLTVTQVVSQKIKPWVKKYGKEGGQSIASLVLKKPETKRGALIMHCMNQNFLELVDALEDRLGPDAFVYLDIFCCNILENVDKQSLKWAEDVFEVISRAGRVILVCDLSLAHLEGYEANPLSRLWCLYEMYALSQFPDAEFEVYFTDGFHATIAGDIPEWSERLRNMPVKVEKAKVTWPKEKRFLLEAIEKRTSVEDFEKIADCQIKTAFYTALRGEKTFFQKLFPCCAGGLPDEKAWVEYLKTAKSTSQTRIADSKPVEVLNEELRQAAAKGNVEEIRGLLAKKARADAADAGAGLTALHKAAFKGQLNVVQFLVQQGVDVNVQDASGATPLHNAAYKGQMPTVQFLIESDGDVNLTDNYSRTPLDKAVTNEHHTVADYLRELGAVVKRLDPNATREALGIV